MLTQSCLDKIKDAELLPIVQHYVHDLKKQGADWKACCPFHAEKSPSFSVKESKNVYKCFGCGKGGNSAISFVIEHDNLTFYEACLTVAKIAGIEIEHEPTELTDQQKEQYKQKQDAATQQEKVLNFVVPIYKKMLADLKADHPAKKWLAEREIDQDTIDHWQIGWAGEEWNTVTTPLINQNLWEAANKLGISKQSKSKDSNYDGYRSRIIFPICDSNGRFIGLGGRYIKCSENDGKDMPKYINPSDCELYNKRTVLYGLDVAIKAIKETKTCNIVEGYMDVISPSRIGLTNIVGTCGTSFTTDQMKLIKRHTNHIIMMHDNDEAGQRSLFKALPELLKLGFRVDVRIFDGNDPDEWVLKFVPRKTYENNHTILCLDYGTTEVAVFSQVQKNWLEADGDVHTLAIVQKQALELLANIPDDIIRNNYLDTISKRYRWKTADTKKSFQKIVDTILVDEDDEPAIKFDKWVTEEQKEEFMNAGYMQVNRKIAGKPNATGYYSFGAAGKTEITNFLIKPLFRIEGDTRYLSEIDNGRKKAIVDIPAKIMPSIDQFQGECIKAGGSFMIYGSKNQWLRIITDLLHRYPSCLEITAIGWQPKGFWCWIDKAFVPGEGIREYDEWGIIEHEEQKYFLAAKSEAYSKLEMFGSDPFENLRYLRHKNAPIKFSEWSKQMHIVYEQKGIVGISYAIISLFRDIIFEIDNNCPHLYGFGEPSSGKSKWAESITALFYYRRAAFNLNSGTDFGFNVYVSTFANCPAHLNEFDIEVIKPEWFQQIKGWFDGEGRIRGKLGSKTSIEIQKIVSTVILTGQKLVTADDNSVVTRSIIEGFSTKEYTEEEKQQYNKLRDLQDAGLGSLVIEILEHRNYFQENYKERFNKQLSTWRKTKVANVQINQRIIQNYAHLATCYNIIAEKITMPQAADDFTEYCFAQSVKWSNHIRTSDTLSEFWRTLEFLVNSNKVFDGWDFDVTEEVSITVSVNRSETTVKNFTTPTKVLYIRLNNIHKLFQQTVKQTEGKNAMTIENILFYFNSRTYFLGSVKSHRFTRFVYEHNETTRQEGLYTKTAIEGNKVKETKNTSCYAFVYEDLGIDITKGTHPPEHLTTEHIEATKEVPAATLFENNDLLDERPF